MRRAVRTDNNHMEIVQALRSHGASVLSLAAIGYGCPDALIGLDGKNLLLEFKNGAKSPSKRRLTPDQQRFHATWKGAIVVVESVEQAIAALKNEVN